MKTKVMTPVPELRLPSAAKPAACMLAIFLTWFSAVPASAQTARNWTGADSANWSDPNNWSPAGVPQNGDQVYFGQVSDANRSTENDLTGLALSGLNFGNNDYTVSGNSITLLDTGIDNGDETGYFRNTSFTTTINCPLVFSNYDEIFVTAGYLNGVFTETTVDLHLNGSLEFDGPGVAALYAGSIPSSYEEGGGNGHLYVAGGISGAGNLSVFCNETNGNTSVVEFSGTTGNSFTGTMDLITQGNTQITFAKTSGVVTSNGISVTAGNNANLNLSGLNQIGNEATIVITAGSELTLNGDNTTVGTLLMTNYSDDALPSVIDTGSTLLGLNGGIIASADGAHVNPIIKGRINFNGPLPVEVDGTILDVQAVVEGAGLNKIGNDTLQLDANNTFTGNLEISAGTVIPSTAAALSPSSAGVILNGGRLQLTSLAIGSEPLFVNSSNSLLITYNTCSWAGPVTLNANFNVLPADNTRSGLITTFSGPISGTGGMLLEDAVLTTGNIEFSGSSANTFTGPLSVECQLLYLDKPSYTEAFAGPLIVGAGPGPICQVIWLNHYQGPEGSVSVYTNGQVDLNGYNDNFGPVSFNGGEIATYSGQLSLYGTVTVNPAGQTAIIGGILNLPPGNAVEFNVSQGYTPNNLELWSQASIVGSAANLIKQGYGTMSLSGTNTSSSSILLQEGILSMDNARALGTEPFSISNGATLNLDVPATLGQDAEMSGVGMYDNGNLGALNVASSMNVTMNGQFILNGDTTLNIGSGSTLQVNGTMDGIGSLTEIGTGTLNIGGTSANVYSGTTYINQGSLVVSKPANTTAVPGNLVIGTKTAPVGNSGTTATGQGVTGSIGGTNLTVNGGSSYTLSGLQFLASVNLVNGGSIQTGTGSLELTAGNGANVVNVTPGQTGASVISGNVYLINGGNFAVNGRSTGGTTPELDLQAGLNDQIPSGISKSGAGQLRLSAINAFSSAMTVNGGELTIANSSSLGSSTNTTVNNNSILNFQNGVTIQNNSLTLNSSNAAALQSLSGSNIWTGNVTLNQTCSLLIGPANGYLNILGAVSGPGGLTVNGVGTLQFDGSNTNTYAGLTTIASGVLEAGRSNLVAGHNLHGQPTTNEIRVTSIPGDVVIGSDAVGAPAATLRSLREQQLSLNLTANVAVHLSGLWDLAYQTG